MTNTISTQARVMARIAAIRAVMDGATKGKWQEGIAGLVCYDGDDIVYVAGAAPHNRQAIALAHNIQPAMLDAIQAISDFMTVSRRGQHTEPMMQILKAFLDQTEGLVP